MCMKLLSKNFNLGPPPPPPPPTRILYLWSDHHAEDAR